MATNGVTIHIDKSCIERGLKLAEIALKYDQKGLAISMIEQTIRQIKYKIGKKSKWRLLLPDYRFKEDC